MTDSGKMSNHCPVDGQASSMAAHHSRTECLLDIHTCVTAHAMNIMGRGSGGASVFEERVLAPDVDLSLSFGLSSLDGGLGIYLDCAATVLELQRRQITDNSVSQFPLTGVQLKQPG